MSVRTALAFRDVNRSGQPGHDSGLQRHHLLPRQLLGSACFGTLFDSVGLVRVGFDDFRANGMLLPANDCAAIRMGLPLHRGPHRIYNAMVIERVGRIEAGWSARRAGKPERAIEEALMRLALLQRALRRRLLDPVRRRLALNRADPLGRSVDFSELDAMADALWGVTDESLIAPPERDLSGCRVPVRHARCDCRHQRPVFGGGIARHADPGLGDSIACAGTTEACVRGIS